MIKSILLKQVATYDEKVGVQINDLTKVNFIYGANGSGKTTLTKFLHNPNTNDPNFLNCSLSWQTIPTKVLVYNKDFRERNFGKGSLNGVFTLGQATKEDIDNIEIKKAELQDLFNQGTTKRETLEKQIKLKGEQENNFKEEVWVEIYKKHEPVFKEAFKGVMQKKESFKERLIHEFKNNTSSQISYTELENKAKIIFGDAPQVILSIPKLDYSEILEIEGNTICQKKIIGKNDVDISKLIQKLNNPDWVSEGRGYLQDDSICPFCQQETITTEFRNKLEEYFDESFTNDNKLVVTISNEYNRLAENLINELNRIEENERAKTESLLKVDLFSSYIKTLTSQFVTNKELLNTKCKEPSRSIELISVKEQLSSIQTLIDDVNEKIISHNAIVGNYPKEKSKLISSIWKYIVDENKIKIESFLRGQDNLQKGIDGISKAVQDLRTNYSNLDKEIKLLSKNITDTQPSIDEINKTLKFYGFTNFEIVKSKADKHKYQIQREDGTLAESTLSEGEITFITFLYFLQRAKGGETEESVNEDRILVVDDPISSLDSNILFVVSSLVKEIIKEIRADKGSIKQLILLTHNVYFHKEASFIDGRNPELKDVSFWILRKNGNISSIQSFGKINPIHTSYELLWNDLKNKAANSNISIQNTMRRIIENYFNLLGKNRDDLLIQKFTTKSEQEICRSLLCWINDGSHSINDDLFIELQDDTKDKYSEVFRSIFEKSGHIEHYKMMMGEELSIE